MHQRRHWVVRKQISSRDLRPLGFSAGLAHSPLLSGQLLVSWSKWWVCLLIPFPLLCTCLRRTGGKPDEPASTNRLYREWSPADILWHLWGCCPPTSVQNSYYPPGPEGNRLTSWGVGFYWICFCFCLSQAWSMYWGGGKTYWGVCKT